MHVVQRSHRRAACFFHDADRVAYLDWLLQHAGTSGCAVHAYVLMGNHVHLLLTPARADSVSCLLHALGEHFARYVGEAHGHSGSLWDERVEIRPVFPKRYLLACMRYIELNPVRAGLVASPDQYRWSSYRSNAMGIADALITPHAFYYALGRTPAGRQAAYRALFQGAILRQLVARYRLERPGAAGGDKVLPRMAQE